MIWNRFTLSPSVNSCDPLQCLCLSLAALGPEAAAGGQGAGRARWQRGGSEARRCPAGSQLGRHGCCQAPGQAGDCLPRLRCWSSQGEIALLHVIFYCLLQSNVLAFISFLFSLFVFPPFYFWICATSGNVYFFFFFSVTKNCRKLPLWDEERQGHVQFTFLSPESSLGENSDASRNEIWQRPLLKVMTRTGFPCSLFLGHCLLKLALFGVGYLGLSVSFFILKYNSEIHIFFLLRELFESVQLY